MIIKPYLTLSETRCQGNFWGTEEGIAAPRATFHVVHTVHVVHEGRAENDGEDESENEADDEADDEYEAVIGPLPRAGSRGLRGSPRRCGSRCARARRGGGTRGTSRRARSRPGDRGRGCP